jgi:hypothetical protein
MHLVARKSLIVAAAAAAVFLGISPASAATAPHSTSPALTAAHLMGPAGVSPQATYVYYSGYTGGAARHASNIYAYQTGDFAEAADNQVVCVQEHVYPNWPSTSGSFFDQYKCGTGYIGVGLNGANVDQAYCWVNGSTVYLECWETY